MIAGIEERPATFEEKGFPGEITMTLRRLESWQWTNAEHAGARASARLRDGAAMIEAYGFDQEEFEVLSNPDSWEGIAEFIYLVELGMLAIAAWNVKAEGEEGVLPVGRDALSRLFRIKAMRDHFKQVMDREGERYRFPVAEGNA